MGADFLTLYPGQDGSSLFHIKIDHYPFRQRVRLAGKNKSLL
jgi:hypothetical protein